MQRPQATLKNLLCIFHFERGDAIGKTNKDFFLLKYRHLNIDHFYTFSLLYIHLSTYKAVKIS